MNDCAFCGRGNLADARFCIDCGRPLAAGESAGPLATPVVSLPTETAFPASAAGSAPSIAQSIQLTRGAPLTATGSARCAQCGLPVDPNFPFCASCGHRVGLPPTPRADCPRCDAEYEPASDLYCWRCGGRLPTKPGSMAAIARTPVIAVLGETGDPIATHVLAADQLVVGRAEADLRFPDDPYLSPMHARLEYRDGKLWVRDLGSRNGTWVFLTESVRIVDGERILVGSQVLRLRRIGYPAPLPADLDETRRMGSLVPTADIAVLEQLRSDGSVRDSLYLSPGRSVSIGRETGDWVFPYDQTMSGLHAEIRSEGAEFFLCDLGSRNGVALGVRGVRPLELGQRILLGDQLLRVESL